MREFLDNALFVIIGFLVSFIFLNMIDINRSFEHVEQKLQQTEQLQTQYKQELQTLKGK